MKIVDRGRTLSTLSQKRTNRFDPNSKGKLRQGSVDCESFRSLSIGVPFCFKLPAYPLRSSPPSVSSSIACPASLYLSLYPRIASVAIITALKEYTRRVIPALCEDSHRDVYVYPSTLSPSLSLSTAHSSPVTPLSPPRYRSTPLSGSSPLFVTAVSPLKHCVPSLSLSPLLLLLLPHLLLPPVAVDAPSPPRVVCVTFLVTTRRVVLPPRSSSVYFWTMDPKKRFNDPIRSRTGTRTYAPTDEHRRKS